MNSGNFSEAALGGRLRSTIRSRRLRAGRAGQPHALSEPEYAHTLTAICNTSAGPALPLSTERRVAGVNTIPASRISLAGGIMMQDLAAISKTIATPSANLLARA